MTRHRKPKEPVASEEVDAANAAFFRQLFIEVRSGDFNAYVSPAAFQEVASWGSGKEMDIAAAAPIREELRSVSPEHAADLLIKVRPLLSEQVFQFLAGLIFDACLSGKPRELARLIFDAEPKGRFRTDSEKIALMHSLLRENPQITNGELRRRTDFLCRRLHV